MNKFYEQLDYYVMIYEEIKKMKKDILIIHIWEEKLKEEEKKLLGCPIKLHQVDLRVW